MRELARLQPGLARQETQEEQQGAGQVPRKWQGEVDGADEGYQEPGEPLRYEPKL